MRGQHSESAPEIEERRIERAILGLLLDADPSGLWAVNELARELGCSCEELADGLASLRGAGLVNGCSDFVFASRAALRFDRLGL
jgi:hypothetical protein